MKHIGIFSGSFNPIHIGHLALANWLCEYGELNEIWFLVTPLNPLKDKHSLMDDWLRFKIVKTAIGDYTRFKASNFEFSLPRPSYTIDTLKALQIAYPGNDFHLIMGADNWVKIDQWKDSETLLKNYPIIIYPRLGYHVEIPSSYPNIRKAEAPIIEISSSFIRESLEKGKDVRFFLPESIHKYFGKT